MLFFHKKSLMGVDTGVRFFVTVMDICLHFWLSIWMFFVLFFSQIAFFFSSIYPGFSHYKLSFVMTDNLFNFFCDFLIHHVCFCKCLWSGVHQSIDIELMWCLAHAWKSNDCIISCWKYLQLQILLLVGTSETRSWIKA